MRTNELWTIKCTSCSLIISNSFLLFIFNLYIFISTTVAHFWQTNQPWFFIPNCLHAQTYLTHLHNLLYLPKSILYQSSGGGGGGGRAVSSQKLMQLIWNIWRYTHIQMVNDHMNKQMAFVAYSSNLWNVIPPCGPNKIYPTTNYNHIVLFKLLLQNGNF